MTWADDVGRLVAGYFNSDDYSAGNPGGLDNNGHKINLPALLETVGRVAQGVGTYAGQVADAAGRQMASSPALAMSWDTGIADGNPGAGKVRGNNASATATTYLYVSTTDADGVDISASLTGLGASTSTVKARLRIIAAGSPSQYRDYVVTGVTAAAGYVKVAVTWQAGVAVLTAGVTLGMGWTAKGDKGDTGAVGTTGTAGTNGTNGVDGINGAGPVWYGTSTGAANAQVLAGPLAVLTGNPSVEWIAGYSNSGAATLKVGTTAATAIRTAAGGALTGGEIVTGTKYVTTYDGTYWRLAGGSGQGKQTIWIPAGAMVSRTTNGPSVGAVESATNKVMKKTLDFDTAVQEYAQFTIAMPKSWNEGTVSFQALWTAASGSGGVAFGLQGMAVSDFDNLDAAFGTAQIVTDTFGTAGYLHQTAESSAITIAGNPADLDMVVFQIYRDVANATDTLAVDALLLGVRLFYVTNSANDA